MNNGDVFDIGQTINGVSQFLWFNKEWYYFVKGFTHKYEYDQDDLEGNFIREWGSCKEIAEHLNVSITAIRNVCNFRMPTCKNYIFKYLEK